MADESKPDAKKPDAKDAPAPKVPGKPDAKKPDAKDEQARGPEGRICHEGERASGALKRFRVRATNAAPEAAGVGDYVLAPDKAAAEECYLRAHAEALDADGWDVATRKAKEGDKKLSLRTDELPD